MSELLVENWQLVLACAIGAVVLVVALVSLRDGPLPYERRGVLLSPPEINFLRSLRSAVREDWIVFSMVRLSDVVKVRSKVAQSQLWQNRIASKHIDFVLCDQETLEVQLAIELDDHRQRRPERTRRDRFVSTALAAAGLPLLKVPLVEKYETAAIRKDIENAIGIRKKKR
ncbi:MAG TPA: DUF2726 domain-containing protein [Pirellulaceae bacterium]|jgi:uncharacterized protein DUF2726|nr:DUF2726 domain-containing protein [Pirellulaceae bacterium]